MADYNTKLNEKLTPNFTQIPNIILDSWMSELSGAEFKILLYVARRTYGFHRESDSISLDQLANGLVAKRGRLDGGTGLSRETVAKNVASLENKAILLRTRHQDERGGNLPSTFSINFSSEFGVKVALPLEGGRKPDPIPEESPDASAGGAEIIPGESVNHTLYQSEGVLQSDRGGVSEFPSRGSGFLTHKIENSEKQIVEKQIETQQQIEKPLSPELHSVVAYSSNRYDSLLSLLTEQVAIAGGKVVPGFDKESAESIIRELRFNNTENVAERITKQREYLPFRTTTDSLAYLRTAILQDYSPPSAWKQAQQELAQKAAAETQRGQATARAIAERQRYEAEQAEKARSAAKTESLASRLSPEEEIELNIAVWRKLAEEPGPPGNLAREVRDAFAIPDRVPGEAEKLAAKVMERNLTGKKYREVRAQLLAEMIAGCGMK